MRSRSLPHWFPPLLLILAILLTASAAPAAPSATRPSPYPAYDVGDTGTLILTTSPVQAHQPVYRWRYRNGQPDGDQPTEIGTTDQNGRFEVSIPLPASSVGAYTAERFAVGSPSSTRSNTLSYRIDASSAPSATRPSPYPNYDVGDTARLEIRTQPVQANQTVYRWRTKNGAPDGAQPTEIGTTDGTGVLIVEGPLGIGEIGDYSGERYSVGTTTGPRSPARSYAVDADFAPHATRPSPYPSYAVGDAATLIVTTSPTQPHQPVYRFRYKNGSPDGSQPTEIGTTDSNGRLTLSRSLTSADIGSYTHERFAVGTTGGPRSSSRSYTVSATPPITAPSISRPAPYPDYQVGDQAVMQLSTSPVQANANVYRWRFKDGQPDGAQPTHLGTTDSSGRLTVSLPLGNAQIGAYTGERFAVGSTSNPRSSALAYTVAPTPTAPIVSRPAPFPEYQVGDVAVMQLSTSPVQPNRPVYRWRLKDGQPDGDQPTEIGTTDQNGTLTVSGPLSHDQVGSYSGEQFAVGRTTSPRSAALSYTVVEPPPPEPPTAFRPAPYPNYTIGQEEVLIVTTDPPQPGQPVYRYRQRNNLPDGAQPTYLGDTDEDGRFEHRAIWPIGSEGFYSNERFAVGAPGHPPSPPLNYNVLEPSTTLQAPTVSRDAPYPSYSVGDIARLILSTNPIQPHQPVYRWRQKDGEDDGAQPTLVGTTNGFGRLDIEVSLPAESAGSYTGEQFAVGSPDGLRSPALAYTISPIASGEIIMSSVEPTDFDSGNVTIATVRGAGFTSQTQVVIDPEAAAWVQTRVLDVSADGTEMTVEVDATDVPLSLGDMTMLYSIESSSVKAQPVRFVQAGPVVDVWTPTVPYAGSTFVLTLLGHHLSGVSVTPEDPSILSVEVMSTSDRRVFGMVTVAEHATEGVQRLRVSRGGRTTWVEMYVLPARNPAVQEQNVLADSSIAQRAKAAGQPVPELLVQPVGVNPELVQQTLELEEQAAKRGFVFTFSTTWRFIYPILRETITFDVETGEVGRIARVLGIGEQLRLGAFTFALTGELYIHFRWRYDTTWGWLPPEFCVEVLIAAEVPGATRTVSFSGCWFFGGGSGPSPGSTTMANIQGGNCAEAITTDIDNGIGYSTITQRDCCEQPLDLRLAGETFGLPFDDFEEDVAETVPDPMCSTTPTCSELELAIHQIDPHFAPSVERLDFVYSIWHEELGAPTFTKLEIFKDGDPTNPIFVDEPFLANVQAEPYTGPDGQQGWDGKDASGHWIHPEDGPFTVRISASERADYTDACTVESTFEVKVHSIDVTPAGAQNLVKPNREATEVDQTATATVNLTAKDGSAVETEIPIELEWSFEDPDDSSARPGIDPDGGGDDNAPTANGGKRGGMAVMWKAVDGHPMTLVGQNQMAEMTTQTTGDDMAQAKVQFSASAIGGDNYILVAKTRDAGPVVEGRSDTWTVRKSLDFSTIYRMPGGADVVQIMSEANVGPAFSVDGHTDYTLTGAVQPIADALYIAPLLPPNGAETPTPAELIAYGNGDAAAHAAITAKAQAWYDRSREDMDDKLGDYFQDNNIPEAAVVGAKYWHPKADGDVDTGAGPELDFYPDANAHFPDGIQIENSSGRRNIDPDGQWHSFEGVELADSAFVFLNSDDPARLEIVGRHEAGHASDHVDFGEGHGTGDHLDSQHGGALMTRFGNSNEFSDTGILRLRGWTP